MMARSKIGSKSRFPGVRLFILAISLSVWIKSQPNAKATRKGDQGLIAAPASPAWLHESRSVARELSYREATGRSAIFWQNLERIARLSL
jgi:hypothetical protein